MELWVDFWMGEDPVLMVDAGAINCFGGGRGAGCSWGCIV